MGVPGSMPARSRSSARARELKMSYIRSFFNNQTVKLYEPKARAWHYATAIGAQCYNYGGCTTGMNAPGREELSFVVEVFDPLLEEWEAMKCTGTTPKGLFGGGCCSSNDDLYVYGGTDGVGWCSGLYKLCAKTKRWSLVADTDTPSGEGPMKKGGCRMVLFDESNLALIGGYGQPTRPTQKGSMFIRNTSFTDSLRNTAGWSNEFHVFDLRRSLWLSPTLTGDRPPPSDGFTFTSIDSHRAVLFGGILHDRRYINDVYVIDFWKMECQKFVPKSGEAWPIGRVEHAACCLGFGEHPQLLLIGGLYEGNKTLNDIWILNMESMKWKEVPVPEGVQPRCCHSLTSISLGRHLIEVIMFGGCAQYDPVKPAEALAKLAGTTVITFGCEDATKMEWKIVDVANQNERGTYERMRRKLGRLREALCRQETQPVHVSNLTEAELNRLREGLRASEAIKKELLHSTQELQHKVQQLEATNKLSESTLNRLRKSNAQTEQQLVECKLHLQQALERVKQVEEIKEREIKKFQDLATEAEDKLMKIEMQWIIQKEEIQVSQHELGRGGWAVVKIAEFRGTKVAAKCFYRELSSKYYQQMFAREMKMASRLRHPNLVQFIGATSLVQGEPIIITELMTTSLREVLKAGPIDHPMIVSISLDVLRALNYLHLMEPHPLIHRDISSANVLLNPVPDGGLKAKVSDYGSVNLVQKLQTVGPGSPVYAAPESAIPKDQSPKMDIYSFGILLVEMLTDQFPEEEHRRRLIASIDHRDFVAIINQCLLTESGKRPSAQELMSDLSHVL